jgi:hypothetical protein
MLKRTITCNCTEIIQNTIIQQQYFVIAILDPYALLRNIGLLPHFNSREKTESQGLNIYEVLALEVKKELVAYGQTACVCIHLNL